MQLKHIGFEETQYYLNVAGKGKVLAEGVPFEAIIRQDPPEVRMAGEEDSVHVPDFAFIPVGGLEDLVGRINRRQLICVRFHANPRIVTEREQIVYDLV